MNFWSLRLLTRDFSRPLVPPPFAWSVRQLTWRAVGGPAFAAFSVSAPDPARLWTLVDLLRCPLTLLDARGPAWWGCFTAVELHIGARIIRVSLDDMANQVAVSYRALSPLTEGGALTRTAFLADPDSVKVYGEKQAVYALGQATAASAEALRAVQLARVAQPQLTNQSARATETPYALLEARGWWQTLSWKYHVDGRGRIAALASGSQVQLASLAANARLVQSFTVGAEGWTATEVWLKAARFRATDTLRLELCASSGGLPAAALASSSLSAAAGNPPLQDGIDWVRFPLSAPLMLQANTTYWLSLTRSGPVSALDYYVFSCDEGRQYPGTLRLWNGSAWVPRDPEAVLTFTVLGVEETGAQLARLLSPSPGVGQFFSGVRVESATGIQAACYADGSQRGQAAVERLLSQGLTGGQRLLARVEPDRTVRVYPQPAASALLSAACTLAPSGALVDPGGRALLPSQWPAGQWLRLGGLSSGSGGSSAGSSTAAGGNPIFIESCTWDGAQMRLEDA